ncbi:MAG: sulfite exporter TauE/SafE family protein [Candidatus Omnitrophota bacterium]|nr:sulfite exporter TauE/SafE family protein [Candidatus Omnitrophota bacterium]
MYKAVFSLFLSGLLLGSGPCLASCGPLLISYICARQKGVLASIRAYLLFSAGRALVYLVLAAGAYFGGQLFSRYISESAGRYLFLGAGVFIMITGVLAALGKSPDFKFCRWKEENLPRKDGFTLILLGATIGILPCLPLLSALTYIGLVSKSWTQSFAYSLAFGLGTVVSPLLVLAALAGLIPRILKDNFRLRRLFHLLCGALIIYLGMQLIRKAW